VSTGAAISRRQKQQPGVALEMTSFKLRRGDMAACEYSGWRGWHSRVRWGRRAPTARRTRRAPVSPRWPSWRCAADAGYRSDSGTPASTPPRLPIKSETPVTVAKRLAGNQCRRVHAGDEGDGDRGADQPRPRSPSQGCRPGQTGRATTATAAATVAPGEGRRHRRGSRSESAWRRRCRIDGERLRAWCGDAEVTHSFPTSPPERRAGKTTK